MKTLILTVSLVASAQAFAQFDALKNLEAGKANYLKALDSNKSDQVQVELIKQAVAEHASVLSTKSPKEVTTACSELMLKSEKIYTDRFSRTLKEEVVRLDAKVKELETNVEKYLSAEACSACDADIRLETLNRYAGRIVSNVSELDRTWSVKHEETTSFVLRSTFCRFNDYFSFQDSEKFTRLKSWSFGEYGSGLSAQQILNGEYDGTIEYIIRNAPIEVERSATRFGKAKSQFKNKKVSMTLKYDFSIVTGYDNVSHPEGNPVQVIHSALK